MASIKVRATQVGLYENKLREAGEEFVITDGKTYDQHTKKFQPVAVEKVFSERWMERIEEPAPKAKK